MNDDVLQKMNDSLIASGFRTIDEFTSDAITQATVLTDHPDVLQGHFNNWQTAQYDPEAPAGLNIRQTLEFRYNTLAKRQFRCDGTVKELRRIIGEIQAGLVEKHYEDVIIADELVKWWSAYTKLYKQLNSAPATP